MNKDIKKVLVTEEEIAAATKKLGEQITKDFKGKNILAVCVLRGAVYFFSDLTRYIELPCKLDFLQASSYGSGTTSSGTITIIRDIDKDLTGYDVILVEDILDTGNTLRYIYDELMKRNPASISIATLLDKPARRVADVHADYVGLDVPNEFVVGYGLDYNQKYRNLPYIGVLNEDVYTK